MAPRPAISRSSNWSMSTRPTLGSCTTWLTNAPSTGQKRTPSSYVRRQRGQLVTILVLASAPSNANGTGYDSVDDRASPCAPFGTRGHDRCRRSGHAHGPVGEERSHHLAGG